jgi:hypothetical protein
VTELPGIFHHKRSRLLKTGFFTHVRELKIQRENPDSALRVHTQQESRKETASFYILCYLLESIIKIW